MANLTASSLSMKGNEIFNQVSSNTSLSPAVYKSRMCEALQYYNKALSCSVNAEERISIIRNIAVTNYKIAKRLHQSFHKNCSTRDYLNEIIYFLEQSLTYYGRALKMAEGIKETTWIQQGIDKEQESAELLWEINRQQVNEDDPKHFAKLTGTLTTMCCKLEGDVRGRMFLRLGRLYFQRAVKYQESDQFKEAINCLHEAHFPLEEAARQELFRAEMEELQESVLIHMSIAESVMARMKADQLVEVVFRENETLDMELVWDIVDWYIQSIILAREKYLEGEAIAHSQLGKLYKVLYVKDKSRDHFKLTLDLVEAMKPRTFNDCTWYQQAFTGMQEFQREQLWKENKEKEKIREPIRLELKAELEAIQKARERGAEILLEHIYKNHPPKRNQKMDKTKELKARLKQALLHYHPDKQDLESSDLKWIVLSEEIAIHLNYFYVIIVKSG